MKDLKGIAEKIFIKRMITELYPNGIVSLVGDSFNFWRMVNELLPQLKPEILAREGKVVIRPDSGDPVKIICGYRVHEHGGLRKGRGGVVLNSKHGQPDAVKFDDGIYEVFFKSQGNYNGTPVNSFEIGKELSEAEVKGAIECLWDVFGGTTNTKGFKELDPHIGLIYGDSITLERAQAILEGLKAKGFASSNVVFGVGSFTYQHVTRDSFGFAMKATYGVVNSEGREIFKDPITDSGTKKSARGLLRVDLDGTNNYVLKDQCTEEEEHGGALETVFKDGKLVKETSLQEIRYRLSKTL